MLKILFFSFLLCGFYNQAFSKNYSSKQSLHKYAALGNVPAMKSILSKSKTPKKLLEESNSKTRNQTPLFFAVKKNKIHAVEFLINSGANVNVKNSKNLTPLCLSAYTKGVLEPTIKINDKIATALIEGGADVNVSCEYGVSPFTVALLDNKLKLAALIWSKGPVINKPDRKLMVLPIHVAAKQGHCSFFKAIAQKNPSLMGAQDKWGWTSFHYATWKGHPCVIDLHFSLNAPIKKDKEGSTPFQVLEFNVVKSKKALAKNNIFKYKLYQK